MNSAPIRLRRLSVALVTVLLAGAAACSGGPSEPPPSGEASEATTESSAPASSSAEETPAYCWGLATFDEEVQEFQEAALVGDIIGESTDPDELAAEAGRLAQSASDLSGEAPESIAAALVVVAASLTEVRDGLLAGDAPNIAVNVMADQEPFDAFQALRAELQTGGCAGMW
jgi:hypothetical protein